MFKNRLNTLGFSGKLSFLLLLIILFLILASLSSTLCIKLFYGKDGIIALRELNKDVAITAGVVRLSQFVSMIFAILAPACVFLYLTQKNSISYLTENKKVNLRIFLFAILIIITIQPLIGVVGEWNMNLKLPESLATAEKFMKDMENKAGEISKILLSDYSVKGFLLNSIIIVLLPAIAEELLFRGVLCKLFFEKWNRVHLAVWISAIIFSAIHFQFFGFVPRLILGAVLGYSFLYTRNILVPITIHFANNMMALILQAFSDNSIIDSQPEEFGSNFPAWVVILFTLVALFGLWKMWKIGKKSKSIEIEQSI